MRGRSGPQFVIYSTWHLRKIPFNSGTVFCHIFIINYRLFKYNFCWIIPLFHKMGFLDTIKSHCGDIYPSHCKYMKPTKLQTIDSHKSLPPILLHHALQQNKEVRTLLDMLFLLNYWWCWFHFRYQTHLKIQQRLQKQDIYLYYEGNRSFVAWLAWLYDWAIKDILQLLSGSFPHVVATKGQQRAFMIAAANHGWCRLQSV